MRRRNFLATIASAMIAVPALDWTACAKKIASGPEWVFSLSDWHTEKFRASIEQMVKQEGSRLSIMSVEYDGRGTTTINVTDV